MPGLSKCYIDIISSQLSRAQILQYCEDLRPESLRRLATLCRAVLQLTAFAVTTAMSFAVRAQIHTSPNDGPELGVR